MSSLIVSLYAEQARVNQIKRIINDLGFDCWLRGVEANHYMIGPIRNPNEDHAGMICELFSRYGYTCYADARLGTAHILAPI